jgi:2-methylcitrate dehydratase PrpD
MEFPDLHAESLLALSGKINVIPDDDYQKLFPNKRPASVLIKLLNGSVYEAYRELRRGDPEDPFTWEQLYQRMRDFAPAMNNQAAERIALWSKQFENSANDLKVCTVPKNLFQN